MLASMRAGTPEHVHMRNTTQRRAVSVATPRIMFFKLIIIY